MKSLTTGSNKGMVNMLMKASRGSGASQRIDPEPIPSYPLTSSEPLPPIEIPEPIHPPISVSDTIAIPLAKGANILTVGEGVTFSGKVIEADSVILQGSADGDINARSVEISASGSLTGTVSCETLDIAGVFSGKASVIGGLSVRKAGRIDGEIRYGSLAVDEGGVVLGTLDQGTEKPPPPSASKGSTGPPPAGSD